MKTLLITSFIFVKLHSLSTFGMPKLSKIGFVLNILFLSLCKNILFKSRHKSYAKEICEIIILIKSYKNVLENCSFKVVCFS